MIDIKGCSKWNFFRNWKSFSKTFNKELKELAQFGRCGKGEREEGKIAYHSLRAGDISSSHTVMFGLMGKD